ncbi:PspA/IM30 family protein [Marimonas lutisalis]|uniref:PspA/IM30 family protein n=1 Tax=Marimonas lutisalis TaxID=2545756 RepID=UPI0010F86355|nr:PspA/IM30 family protein [Marimonas lutisalis]
MFSTLRTLFSGAQARADERITDHFALELIDQKIRETEAAVKAAKATLASLIQRRNAEQRQVDALKSRIEGLMDRARAALASNDEALAAEAAQAIATMENELEGRNETLARLEQKVLRLRNSVEAGNRRVVDLKQGAIQARAVRREQDIQKRLSTTLSGRDSASEAEELINRVLGRDDPYEQAEILKQIEDDLSHRDLEDRMSDAGYGPATKITAKSVLDRLKADKAA